MRCFFFYIDDWLSSKQIEKMDAYEERGYLRLILAAASEEGPPSIPDDDEELAILSKLGSQWWKPTKDKDKRLGEKRSGQKLRECWTFKPENAFAGRLYNKKLYEAWKKQKDFADAKSEAGKKGNSKRWGDRKSVAQRQVRDSQKRSSVVAPLDDGNGGSKKEEKDATAAIWDAGAELLGAYPGTESLPGKPDHIIVSSCFEICEWDLDVMSEALKKLFQSGKKPSSSWAWFPAVLPQYVEKRAI